MIGGTEAETALKSLEEYAHKKENWYRPLEGKVPGDHEPYVRLIRVQNVLGGEEHRFRIVFTYTVSNGILFRHASISKDDRKELPDPVSVFTICKFLGFTGAFEQWMLGQHPSDENVLVAVQDTTEKAL